MVSCGPKQISVLAELLRLIGPIPDDIEGDAFGRIHGYSNVNAMTWNPPRACQLLPFSLSNRSGANPSIWIGDVPSPLLEYGI